METLLSSRIVEGKELKLTPVSDKQSVRCFRAAELAQKEATAQ